VDHRRLSAKYTSDVIHGNVAVRAAAAGDLEALNEIYNRYVTEAHYTFDIEPMTIETRRDWFSHYAESGPHHVLVAVSDESVVGYASSSRFRPKVGYNTSVETSIYLAPDAVGRGIGFRLYEGLFKALEGEDLHRAYAGIALPNPASIALHERFGFKRVAHFTEQGRKFGRYWDVAWYEKPLGDEPAGSAAMP
jgi:phosphinothricin acetyltransferase